ncbi:hypothetical protein BZA70DRAFT_286451 [Myxozyma melibiosi]|uniref:Uncharacterized protein n=1 Tax=Myxozyma melibiosi TaxID=54550 RepID=A0ABR1FBD0_9ASCO
MYRESPAPVPREDNEIDEDYSTCSSVSSYDSDAQAEWDESFRQIQFIFSAVIFPLLGRFVGRQFAIKLFTKFSVAQALKNII